MVIIFIFRGKTHLWPLFCFARADNGKMLLSKFNRMVYMISCILQQRSFEVDTKGSSNTFKTLKNISLYFKKASNDVKVQAG